MGRKGLRHTIEEMTERKNLVMNLRSPGILGLPRERTDSSRHHGSYSGWPCFALALDEQCTRANAEQQTC